MIDITHTMLNATRTLPAEGSSSVSLTQLDRREALVGLTALGLSTRVPSSLRGDPLPRKVLLIDLDDIGHEYLEARMTSGGAPNLARAFQIGRSYAKFWAAPTCSIFRGRVLSGLDAYRPGNLIGRHIPDVAAWENFAGPAGLWMPDGLPGQCVKIGKCHVTGANPFPGVMHARGFDRFVGTRGNLADNGGGYYNWLEQFADAQGTGSTQQTQHNTTRTAQLALQEIALGVEFINLSFNAVHAPLQNPPAGEPAGVVYSGSGQSVVKNNMLFHLDYWVGEVFKVAVAAGYIVLIACDNGTAGDGKATHFEDGIRTPLVIVGQGVVPGVSPRLVQATDLWATVRRLRGDTLATALDSFDFSDDFLSVPVLHASRQFLTVDWYPNVGVAFEASEWSRAIRDARWKYVDQKLNPNAIAPEPLVGLWDLDTDPEEKTNLLKSPLTPEALAAHASLLANLQQLP